MIFFSILIFWGGCSINPAAALSACIWQCDPSDPGFNSEKVLPMGISPDQAHNFCIKNDPCGSFFC